MSSLALAYARKSKRVICKPHNYTAERMNHLHTVYNEPDKWNCADIVCYYAKVYESVFDSVIFPRWKTDNAIAKTLLNQWGKDVKIAIQIYFSLLDDYIPATMNGIVSQFSQVRINYALDHETPLYVRVIDKRVFKDWL